MRSFLKMQKYKRILILCGVQIQNVQLLYPFRKRKKYFPVQNVHVKSVQNVKDKLIKERVVIQFSKIK